MSNLPISNSSPQVATPVSSAVSADAGASAQPFGDVLAKQVADVSATNAGAVKSKKLSPKTAEEIFAQLKSKADNALAATPVDPNAALSNGILAVLMPQVTVAVPTAPAPAPEAASAITQGAATEVGALSKKPMAIETAVKPLKGDIGVASKQDTGAEKTFSASIGNRNSALQELPVDFQKEATLVPLLGAIASNKVSAGEDKLAGLSAAPLPNATTLATMQATALTPVNLMPTQATINTPISQDNWGDEFNQKITWLATSKDQTAELHLNPPQLGPMDVVLKVSGDQATALFTSPHAQVRDAIEQALPKLREMMADNGIMLGNATVSDQAPRGRQDNENRPAGNARSGIAGVGDTASTLPMVRVSPIGRHNGIVDTFA